MRRAQLVATSSNRPTPTRKPMVPTPQQIEIFDTIESNPTNNVMVVARAGTGKSSTALELQWRLLDLDPALQIRYTCFNKDIATEFKERSPANVAVGTMSSFGLQALKMTRSRLFDEKKSYGILESLGHQHEPSWLRRTVAEIVAHAKNAALHPDDILLTRKLANLIGRFDLCPYGREEEYCVKLAKDVLIESAINSYMIDFNDLLWLPVITDCIMPSCDYLLIDEAQDLSPVQHALATKMNPNGCTIPIGDDRQAIYGWRGADQASMSTLARQLDAAILPLTVSWRCPESHVRLAQRLVPDFQSAPNARIGTIEDVVGPYDDEIKKCQPGDLVLCRTNAPLVRGAIGLAADLRKGVVRGRDIGHQLASIARKIDASTIKDFVTGVRSWASKEIERVIRREENKSAVESFSDKESCLLAIAETCSSPVEVGSVLDMLFTPSTSDDQVVFSTVHKAKGSEADRVVYLVVPYSKGSDKRKPPSDEERQQRQNLTYVALTRSKDYMKIVYPEEKPCQN